MLTKNPTKHSLAFLAVAVLTAALTSCASRPARKISDDSAQATKTETDAAYTPGADVTEASLRGGEFASVEGLGPIYFDYDSSNLKEGALAALKTNAAYLKAHPDLDTLVAGFCDDRGTIEYNLALGQKRAKSVREYYMRLGVSGKSIATISYGKENQVCSQATDDCWAKNRRAETRIRARTAANGSAKSLPQ